MKHVLLKVILFFSLLFPIVVSPAQTHAQNLDPNASRSYQYEAINTAIHINQDSTIDVEETQIFNFIGTYHKGYRSIPIKNFDTVTDISVIDGETNQPLTYSNKILNKEDPVSWGKYTNYKENGNQIIEWYYDASNTKHTWMLTYKVHGVIAFNKQVDRLYWSILTNYDVDILRTETKIIFPTDVQLSKTHSFAYRTNDTVINKKLSEDLHTITFVTKNIAPQEAFTIDVDFPKGVVSQEAYWKDFFGIYYGYFLSVLIILLCLVVGTIFWLLTEKLAKGRSTIVPEYKPPKDLRPAIAEILITEHLTSRGFAATIIDLAIRGYVKIEEEQKTQWSSIGYYIITAAALAFGLYYAYALGSEIKNLETIFHIIRVVFFVIIVISLTRFTFKRFKPAKDFVVSLQKPTTNSGLEAYERKYLEALMQGKDSFSTKLLKRSRSTSLFEDIKKVKELIYNQTEVSTNAYEIGFEQEKKMVIIWTTIFIVGVFLISFFGSFIFTHQMITLMLFSGISVLSLFTFVKYEARLSKEGRILRDDWLGFKLYLETADRYRLQNLTPDMFQKYLPYAMIFGIEKKWAQAFDKLHLPQPNWYVGSYTTGGGTFTTSASSFSASTFSASFSSAFASNFASSSAGGGAGGGSAGGGGGGGGGGAS